MNFRWISSVTFIFISIQNYEIQAGWLPLINVEDVNQWCDLRHHSLPDSDQWAHTAWLSRETNRPATRLQRQRCWSTVPLLWPTEKFPHKPQGSLYSQSIKAKTKIKSEKPRTSPFKFEPNCRDTVCSGKSDRPTDDHCQVLRYSTDQVKTQARITILTFENDVDDCR